MYVKILRTLRSVCPYAVCTVIIPWMSLLLLNQQDESSEILGVYSYFCPVPRLSFQRLRTSNRMEMVTLFTL